MLLYDPAGTLEKRQTSGTFIRRYGAGGIEIVPEKLVEEPAKPLAKQGDAPVPQEEILAAIEETALRYGRHSGLRSAGLSVSEWMALFRANIEIESDYRPDALSDAGAFGLGQLMPDTASRLGVDHTDMMQNLDGSARYLLMLLEKFQSAELALAGYNAGPQAVVTHGGIPPYEETKGHVLKVMAVFSRLKGDV